MIFVPLPFVVTLLLALLLLNVVWHREERPAYPAFIALIALAALQSVLIGLRFGYGIEWVRFLSPLLASVMAPLVYLGACSLVRPQSAATVSSLLAHSIPLLLVALSLYLWPPALDAIIIGTFLIYAAMTLLLLRSGTDALRFTALEGVGSVHRALVLAACVLVFSAAVDALITIDVVLTQARHLTQLVSIGNLATLLFISFAVAVASAGGRSDVDDATASNASVSDETKDDDAEIMKTVEALMTRDQLYRDCDLNLDRLARRALIPTRQISGAINRTTGKNVSQFVNDYRINEACNQLENSSRSVTDIMFDVGFQTKSNFNREFRRMTGMTPLNWRQAKSR